MNEASGEYQSDESIESELTEDGVRSSNGGLNKPFGWDWKGPTARSDPGEVSTAVERTE
jgi:hypothetical protein